MLKKSAYSQKFIESALTQPMKSGLIRSVARIAQSVEQGIENPRVLGSIPSPAPLIQRTRPKGGFLLCISLRSTLAQFQLN